MSTSVETPPLDPEIFRADFPILGRCVRDAVPLVYFDNAASTQRPKQVIQADRRLLRGALCQRPSRHPPVGPGVG